MHFFLGISTIVNSFGNSYNILGPQAPQHELTSKYMHGVAKHDSPLAIDGAAWGHVGGC
jgi:hypothetical protein